MSRIGLKSIEIPAGVTISVDAANVVTVKGPKGELSESLARELTINVEGNALTVTRANDLRRARSQHGLARTLIANMVEGVTKGHTKQLDIIGVGYRAQMEGKNLLLNMGYSHPVRIAAPEGIIFELVADEKARTQSIKISGIDKQSVGQVAADVRKVRSPEPYKGKGIRYRGEVVKLKAGKRAAAKK